MRKELTRDFTRKRGVRVSEETSRRTNKGSGRRQSKVKFINLDFSHNQRVEIADWLSGRSTPVDKILHEGVDAGIKISVSWSDYHDAYQFSATVKQPDSRDGAICYSYRHRDFGRCFAIFEFLLSNELFIRGMDKYTPGSELDW